MGTWSFPGVKRPVRGVDHPPRSSAEVEERVELYICPPSGPSWPGLGRTLPLLLHHKIKVRFLFFIHFMNVINARNMEYIKKFSVVYLL